MEERLKNIFGILLGFGLFGWTTWIAKESNIFIELTLVTALLGLIVVVACIGFISMAIHFVLAWIDLVV